MINILNIIQVQDYSEILDFIMRLVLRLINYI